MQPNPSEKSLDCSYVSPGESPPFANDVDDAGVGYVDDMEQAPHGVRRVSFSTRVRREGDLDVKQDDTEEETVKKGTRLIFFTPFNISVMLLMAGLAVASVLLPLRAWQDAVDTHNTRLSDSFQAVVTSHVQALREALETVESRMLQFDAFLQQVRTLESLRTFASRDAGFTAAVLWLPHVLHSERDAFVAETTATYRVFFNDSSYVANLTDLVYTNGTATGLIEAEPAPEYFPIQFMANVPRESYHPSLPGINLNSELSRANALALARESRDLALSSRIFTVTTQTVSAFLTRPVYEAANASHLLGMLVVPLYPVATVSDAVDELSPANIRLRIFDTTAEFEDQSGCLKPLLYDGERDGATGEWEAAQIDPSYCPEDPHELADSDAVVATASIGQHEWLLIFDRGSAFDDDDMTTSLDLVVLSAVLATLTVLLIVGVLTRGWWIMGVLRESQQRELKASQQSKSFLSFVTHELRNPLFALMGTSGELSALAEDENCSTNVTSLISSIEVSAERMSTILDDVLSMRKLEEGKMELDMSPTSLQDVAQELHAMFAPRAKASGVRLRSFVRRDLPGVVMDSGRVVQVVSNFLSNAIKFTQRGGSVELHIRSVAAPEWFRAGVDSVRSSAADKRKPRRGSKVKPKPVASHAVEEVCPDSVAFVSLEVRDSGKGISSQEMGRLFQPYMQASSKTAREHGGTGLGLYICKKLVESMGGEVCVTSRQGEGSVFAAVLPLAVVQLDGTSTPVREQSATPQRRPRLISAMSAPMEHTGVPVPMHSPMSRSHSTPRRGSVVEIGAGAASPADISAVMPDSVAGSEAQPLQRLQEEEQAVKLAVLIVDDQAINRRILGNLFRRYLPTFEVRYAKDGAEALEDVKRRADEYLLVLMDVVMPVMDGRASVREMRACGLDLPVIAVTGGVSAEEMEDNWAAGFSDVMVKPLRRPQLLGLVSKYLRQQTAGSQGSASVQT